MGPVLGDAAEAQPSSYDLYLRLKKRGTAGVLQMRHQLREEREMRKNEQQLRLEAEQQLREYATVIEELRLTEATTKDLAHCE